jgi:hypothetical protein
MEFTPYQPPPSTSPRPVTSHALIWVSIAAGLLYGLLGRFVFHLHSRDWNDTFSVMSKSYLFGVPFALGFLQVYIMEAKGERSWVRRIFTPWIPAAALMFASLLLLWEGIICIVVIAPVLMIVASLGGLAAGIVRDLMRPKATNFVFCCCLVLPIVMAPIEHLQDPPRQFHDVKSSIEVHATPRAIWDQIKTVPRITPSEQIDGWTYRIGFPRPVEATLSHEGVGGVRRATFERGVLFIETITRWEPERDLAFSIHADTASIPPTTLDDHVTVGGAYFDVLEGEYRIEPIGASRAILHLRSRQRLSTRFNAYASLWTDAIMRDIQESILTIIKRRCELRPNGQELQ